MQVTVFLRCAIPPLICDHAVGHWEGAGGNGGVADAGFGGGVRIGGGAIPGAFLDEAFEAAGPLVAKFVDVVAAHLVDDEEDDEFGALRSGGGRRRVRSAGLASV